MQKNISLSGPSPIVCLKNLVQQCIGNFCYLQLNFDKTIKSVFNNLCYVVLGRGFQRICHGRYALKKISVLRYVINEWVLYNLFLGILSETKFIFYSPKNTKFKFILKIVKNPQSKITHGKILLFIELKQKQFLYFDMLKFIV